METGQTPEAQVIKARNKSTEAINMTVESILENIGYPYDFVKLWYLYRHNRNFKEKLVEIDKIYNLIESSLAGYDFKKALLWLCCLKRVSEDIDFNIQNYTSNILPSWKDI